MTQQPPRRPPVPSLSTYRPHEDRQGGQRQPVEPRFGAPNMPEHAPQYMAGLEMGAPQMGYQHGGQMPPQMGAPPPAGRRPAPQKRKRSWLRIIAWTIGGLGALTAAGLAALIAFAPVGMMREQAVREIKVRTGRDLIILGRTSLSVFPSLAVTMADVSLSSPPGMAGGPFVKMKRLEARVPLMPLLSRKVTVEQLVLTEPSFELRVDQRGRRSWDFAELALPAAIMVAQAPRQQGTQGTGSAQPIPPELQDFLRNSSQPSQQSEPDSATSTSARPRRQSVQDFTLGDVRIDNGTVRYIDERSGMSEEVRAINARLTGTSLTQPIEARGDLALRGDKIDFDGRISSPKALLEERPSRVALAISSPKASGRYDGSLSIAKGAQLDGNIKLDTGSVRGLARWIGAHLPAGPGLGAFALDGELKTGGTWLALNNAKVKLDEIAGTGSVSVDMAGGRPNVKAAVRLGAVDLNPYLPQEPADNRGGGGAATAGPARTPTPPAAKPGVQVKGFTQRSGWSEAPIDLTVLGLLDAEVRLSMSSLLYEDIKIGATQLGLGLKNRVLKTTLDDIRLYGGQGRGVVTVEPTGQTAAVAVNLTLDGVSGLPLLKDASGFDWVDGKARIQLAVGGNGGHQRAIMETLSGKAEFGFTDGAIVGYNIPQMIRGLGQGKIGGFNRAPAERTDFSEAGASFQIRNGVAETKDLRAMSPLIRLTGTGTVNLGQRQIDAVLRPKLVGTLTGQQAAGQQGAPAGDLSGLELPIKIKGPWERPQVAADMEGLLKNPNQAVETIRELGKQLQQGKTGGLNQLIDQFRRK